MIVESKRTVGVSYNIKIINEMVTECIINDNFMSNIDLYSEYFKIHCEHGIISEV